jgi:site-specific DNA recombinase
MSRHRCSRGSAGRPVTRRSGGSALEARLTGLLRRLVPSAASDPLDLLTRVEIHAHAVHLLLPAGLPEGVYHRVLDGETLAPDRQDPSQLRLVLAIRMQLHGGQTVIVGAADAPARPDLVLIRALRAAHAMLARDAGGEPMLEAIPASPYHRRLLRLAFLAPELQRAILAGRQPVGLTLKQLLEQRPPLLWTEQVRVFGCGDAGLIPVAQPRRGRIAAPCSAQ